MRCPSCGKEYSDEYKFCLDCGTALVNEPKAEPKVEYKYAPEEAPQPQQATVKKNVPKTIIVAALTVIAVIVAVTVISNVLSSGSDFAFKTTIMKAFYIPDEEVVGLAKNGVNTGVSIDSTLSGGSSMYGNVYVVPVFSDNTLNVYANDQLKTIEDFSGYKISSDGSKIAVLNADGELNLYDTSTWKKERVATDASDLGLTISPDGASLTYTVYDDDEYKAYVYKNGSSETIGKRLIPFGIGNSAKYIYCFHSENGGVYVVDEKGNSTKLSGDAGTYYIFNKDRSQMIFTTNDSIYVTVRGGEKIKISGKDNSISLSAPEGAATEFNYYSIFFQSGLHASIYTYTYGVSNLAEKFYITGSNKLIYLDKEWNVTTVASGLSSVTGAISREGKTLCYVKNDRLYKVDSKDPTNSISIADDVISAKVASDGKSIYYVDDSETLWYKNGDKDAKRIADDVDSMVMTYDDYLLFLADYSYSSYSGILYSSKNGGEKSKISDDAYNLSVDGNIAYYMSEYSKSDSTGGLYAAQAKDKFELVENGVR